MKVWQCSRVAVWSPIFREEPLLHWIPAGNIACLDCLNLPSETPLMMFPNSIKESSWRSVLPFHSMHISSYYTVVPML
uniref:Ovule protein n=1 Tax=Steinernema glaseri TaxID=37863 RepID=A0A1I7YKW9_9BILA